MDVDSDCEAGGLSGQLLLRVGALMLRGPAHDACISLPDPLLDAAPQFYGGASQLGLFWCALWRASAHSLSLTPLLVESQHARLHHTARACVRQLGGE